MRSLDMAQTWLDHSSKLPTVASSSPKICCCGQFGPNIITTYNRDFQAWNLSKHQPFKHHDNLRVFQGVSLLHDNERQPIENKTSYKSSFIPYQLESMKRLDRPVIRSSILLGEPMCRGHHTSNGPFKSWTAETKFPRSVKDNLNRFLSTTHADYIEHALQRNGMPKLQARPSSHGSRAPLEYTTTMKEDFIKWDLPRRPATQIKDRQKSFSQISFSPRTPEANRCTRCHGQLRPKLPQSRPSSFKQ